MPSARPAHQTTLVYAGIATLAVWAIPALQWLLLPVQYLNTHLHELCHALAALATQGDPQHIGVFADGSGVTPVSGGWLPLIASAGYVGTTAIGAAMLAATRKEQDARITSRVLAAGLGLSMLAWVRGDLVGIVMGVFWVVLLFVAGWKAKGKWLVPVIQFLAIQLALSSVQSVYVLFRISVYGQHHSDATIMQQATGIPAAFWAFGWVIASLALVFLAARRALKG